MVYHGRIKNGQIILDEQARLPEGAMVRVDVVENGEATARGRTDLAVWSKLVKLAGSAEGLPSDYARNLDHYLYGAPKVDE